MKMRTVKVKELDDEVGVFKGYLSTYENEDRTGDVIIKGAFDESIKNNSVVPMCFNHDRNKVLGKMELSSDEKGLLVKGMFNLNDPLAQNIYDLLKMGALNSTSIGMAVKDYEPIDPKRPFGAWTIKSAEVLEGSIVTVPANEQAKIEEVKALSEEERVELNTLRSEKRVAKVANILKEAQELLTK